MKTMALVRNRRMAIDGACAIVALIGGLVAGVVDFNNNEPQAAVLVIVFFAGLLGFAQPRKAWRWAIVVGFGVPIVYLIATVFGLQLEGLPEPGWYAMLIALIPAFFSTYCGVLLRLAISAE